MFHLALLNKKSKSSQFENSFHLNHFFTNYNQYMMDKVSTNNTLCKLEVAGLNKKQEFFIF